MLSTGWGSTSASPTSNADNSDAGRQSARVTATCVCQPDVVRAGSVEWGPTSRPVPQWTRPGATAVETRGRHGHHH
jgi:hypothetical protein